MANKSIKPHQPSKLDYTSRDEYDAFEGRRHGINGFLCAGRAFTDRTDQYGFNILDRVVEDLAKAMKRLGEQETYSELDVSNRRIRLMNDVRPLVETREDLFDEAKIEVQKIIENLEKQKSALVQDEALAGFMSHANMVYDRAKSGDDQAPLKSLGTMREMRVKLIAASERISRLLEQVGEAEKEANKFSDLVDAVDAIFWTIHHQEGQSLVHVESEVKQSWRATASDTLSGVWNKISSAVRRNPGPSGPGPT